MKKLLMLVPLFMLTLNISGCFIVEEVVDEYKLTCKIDGVSKTFYGSKFGLDTYDSTFNNFYVNPDNDDEDFLF